MKSIKCKKCGARILCLKTPGGDTAVEPEQVIYWDNSKSTETVYTTNGELHHAVFSGNILSAAGVGYKPYKCS